MFLFIYTLFNSEIKLFNISINPSAYYFLLNMFRIFTSGIFKIIQYSLLYYPTVEKSTKKTFLLTESFNY